MKIKLLTPVGIDGRVRKAGDELDVRRPVAVDLINRKRAVSLEAAEPAKTIDSEALQEKPKRSRKASTKEDADGSGDAGDE